jgi:type I restriction enzyme S subunit
MNSWRETFLGKLLRIEHGFAFKGEYFSEAGELVVLTPGNFHETGGFRARPDKDRFYQGRFPDRYLLRRNDLIVAMTEQGEGLLGSSALIPQSGRYLHNQRLGLVRTKTDAADKRFLYYLFNSDYVRQQVRNSSSGAKVRHTSPERIYRIKVLAPDKSYQTKVAAILSAYDELIYNNTRRVALLEKMAVEIYREWFVRLRFPGHQHVKTNKGVPYGWERKSLPEFADITYGFAFDGSQFNSEGRGKPIIRIRNIPDSSTGDYTEQQAKDKYIVHKGDLLIGMDGEFHINHWYGDEAYLVQRVCRLKAKNPLFEGYLALAVRAPIKHFESILMGATVGHLGAVHLRNTFLVLPPKSFHEQLQVFNEIYRQKLLLASAVRILSRTRDALLSRLISGKLPVENLDIQFPPDMAGEANSETSATVYA